MTEAATAAKAALAISTTAEEPAEPVEPAELVASTEAEKGDDRLVYKKMPGKCGRVMYESECEECEREAHSGEKKTAAPRELFAAVVRASADT